MLLQFGNHVANILQLNEANVKEIYIWTYIVHIFDLIERPLRVDQILIHEGNVGIKISFK